MYIIVHLGGEGIYRCNAKKKRFKAWYYRYIEKTRTIILYHFYKIYNWSNIILIMRKYMSIKYWKVLHWLDDF